MGDPAELSEADVNNTIALARAIVESVRNDDPFPLGSKLRPLDEERILLMAQLLTVREVVELIGCINWSKR